MNPKRDSWAELAEFIAGLFPSDVSTLLTTSALLIGAGLLGWVFIGPPNRRKP